MDLARFNLDWIARLCVSRKESRSFSRWLFLARMSEMQKTSSAGESGILDEENSLERPEGAENYEGTQAPELCSRADLGT
jgi:hypothetical protein